MTNTRSKLEKVHFPLKSGASIVRTKPLFSADNKYVHSYTKAVKRLCNTPHFTFSYWTLVCADLDSLVLHAGRVTLPG